MQSLTLAAIRGILKMRRADVPVISNVSLHELLQCQLWPHSSFFMASTFVISEWKIKVVMVNFSIMWSLVT